jgi:hypothetical protein
MTARLPLTPGRRAALIIGVPVTAALFGWMAFSAVALASQVSYRVHLSVPVTGQGVRLALGQADAVVRAGSGSRIQVGGTLSGSLARPEFHWRPIAAGLALAARCPVPTGNCNVDFHVTVPSGLPLNVSGSSGDLDVSGFRGQVTLSDGSGDLSASRLAGTISLSSGSGDITASGLTGGRVRVTNGSGNIDVTGLAATDVVGGEKSGDVTLTFTRAPRRVSIENGSGNITLVLPRGPSYQVDARSSSGQTSVGVKTRPSAPYVITAINRSGDINVTYG